MSKERTEEQKAQDRERAKKYRERKKAEAAAQAAQEQGQENQTGAAAPAEFESRPTVEDAEAAYNAGDADGERMLHFFCAFSIINKYKILAFYINTNKMQHGERDTMRHAPFFPKTRNTLILSTG